MYQYELYQVPTFGFLSMIIPYYIQIFLLTLTGYMLNLNLSQLMFHFYFWISSYPRLSQIMIKIYFQRNHHYSNFILMIAKYVVVLVRWFIFDFVNSFYFCWIILWNILLSDIWILSNSRKDLCYTFHKSNLFPIFGNSDTLFLSFVPWNQIKLLSINQRKKSNKTKWINWYKLQRRLRLKYTNSSDFGVPTTKDGLENRFGYFNYRNPKCVC